MSRFLFCPAPQLGDINPTVPLALALRARGHDVAYLVTPEAGEELRGDGFTCFFAPGGVYGGEEPLQSESPCSPRRLAAQLESVARAYDAFAADVLIDGAFPFGPRLFAESRDVPHATVFSGCYAIPTSDALFPHGPGHLPPSDAHGASLARLAAVVQGERDEGEIAEWNATRASLGLAASAIHPARSVASQHLVLLTSPPAFEYPRSDLPSHYWFVGPLIREEPVAEMPERVRSLSDEDPIVYVSQGATYNRNPLLLKLAFAALAGEPVQVVATTVRAFDRSEFGALPDNVILERFVPFPQLVSRIALAVTHGGAGTVHAALYSGVPVVVLPFCADQFEVAARCVWSGAGRRLDPWTCTPERLRDEVRAVLNDATYRANARRIMASARRCGGAQLAASLVEELALRREPIGA